MSHIKAKKGNLITQTFLIDPENGEILHTTEYETKKQETVLLKINRNSFKQFHERLYLMNFPSSLIAFIHRISPYIEFQTGRLTISHVGRTPIPLKSNKSIADELEINRKTVGLHIDELLKNKVIIKIKGELYMNPTFVSFGKLYNVPIISEMIKEDNKLNKYIPLETLKNINTFKKVS